MSLLRQFEPLGSGTRLRSQTGRVPLDRRQRIRDCRPIQAVRAGALLAEDGLRGTYVGAEGGLCHTVAARFATIFGEGLYVRPRILPPQPG